MQTAAAVTMKMREFSADKVGVIRTPGQIGIEVQCSDVGAEMALRATLVPSSVAIRRTSSA